MQGLSRAVDHRPWQPSSVTEPPAQETASPEERSFLRWLFRQRGLNAEHYREQTLLRRLPACLRALRVSSLQQARVMLQRSDELIEPALSALLIGVTSFFRDPQVFEHLRQRVLPMLAEQSGGRLRVWSIACSDGAELYSVALLLDELGILQDAQLLGTDCRADAIARAQAGRFDLDAVRNISQSMRQRHFTWADGQLQISAHLRQRTQWRVSDVTKDSQGPGWNLLLCRNAIMYMRASVICSVSERLEAALAPRGVLVVGKAERPMGLRPMRLLAPCIYCRD